MASRVRTTAIVAVVLAGAASGFVAIRRNAPPKSPEPFSRNEAAPISPKGARGGGCSFRDGDVLAFALEVEGKAVLRPDRIGVRGDVPAPSTHRTSAKLHVKALGNTDSQGTVLVARWSDLVLPDVEGDVGDPFLLRVGTTCALTGYARLATTGLAAARASQSLAHELDFTRPSSEAGAGEVEADNGVGRYRATFTSSGRGDDAIVKSTARTYLRFWGSSAGDDASNAGAKDVPSEFAVVLGPGSWFTSLRRHEVLSGTGPLDTDVVTTVRSDVPRAGAFEGVSTDVARYAWQNLLPRALRVREKKEVTSRDLKARAAVANATLDAQVGAFLERSRSGMNFAETWPAMTTFLEARPETTAKFVSDLRHEVIPPEGRAGGWLAVGNARTPEAKAALEAVVEDSTATAIDRSRAAFALVDRDDVGVPLATSLARHSQAITSGATFRERMFARESTLAMGMMAGLRAGSDPEVHRVAMDTLQGLLVSQKSAKALHPVFGALGNVGDVKALEWVKPFTESPDPKVREGASQVVRRMQPSETTELVAGWLARETDPDVKRHLYTTLQKQSHDAHLPADHAVLDRAIVDLAANPGITTRRAIVHLLGKAAETYAPAHDALVRQAPLEIEKRSGLYAAIAPYLHAKDLLPSRDVWTKGHR
ncbi:MAG: hypothetical protein U0169_07210 [Polyangiaceae bacterium]